MDYIPSKEASVIRNVSERIVRKDCTKSRIQDAVLENSIWYIPEGTTKPKREDKIVAVTPLISFTNKIQYQRKIKSFWDL